MEFGSQFAETLQECLSVVGVAPAADALTVDILDIGSVQDCQAACTTSRPVHWISAMDPQRLTGELVLDGFEGTWFSAAEGMIWHSQGARRIGWSFEPSYGSSVLPYVKAVAIAMKQGASPASIEEWLDRVGSPRRTAKIVH